MKNLLIFLTISLGFFNSVLSQTKYNWRNTNEHYQGLYEENRVILLNEYEFPQDKVSLSILLENNIYVIKLKIWEYLNDSIFKHEYKYDGKYSVNEEGRVYLYDQHPFNSNKLDIKENTNRYEGKKRIDSRTIKVKLNDEFQKVAIKKLILKCYGCLLEPDKENYRVVSYFPVFYSSYVNVKY